MLPLVSHHGRVRLYAADCREALRTIPSNSVDSVVTDPPYALVSVLKRFGGANAAPAKHGTDGLYARASAGFMGETWDTGETAFAVEFWSEVFRVLKPGGHVLAMSATRTYHRLAVAIEDAGFDIRDQLAWVYGSGFPKNHSAARLIDKTFGLKGEGDGLDYQPWTEEAAEWDGWGTAIKPAWEPICMARKPLEGSLAANLAKWRVGGLNIRASLVPSEQRFKTIEGGLVRSGVYDDFKNEGGTAKVKTDAPRWPANIMHDGSPEVLAAFGDHARFFYCPKASPADRDEGLDHMPIVTVEGGGGTAHEKADAYGSVKPNRRNVHPTVKPTPLMAYQINLVTPPGGVVLDPFMGSGSTGKAAILGGFRFIGVEQDARYVPIASARIDHAVAREEWWENAA